MNPGELLVRLGGRFAAHARQLYVVGGTVRDDLLGRETQDIDLTTDARPDQVKELLTLASPDVIYTIGEKYGTIGSIFGGLKVEITTFRSEHYTAHSRKPTVSFGTSLKGDLARRDFTINAMARDVLTGVLIDPFGGLRDTNHQLVRAVGDPDERFAEDPLRLLRAIRLCSELGFELDNGTSQAIQRNAESLADISRERVLEEMNRILLATNVARGLRMLVDLGLATQIIPELVGQRTTSQGRRTKDVFAHTIAVVERTPPDLVLRWAALLHDIGKPRTVIQRDNQTHFPGHELVGEQMARQILTRLRVDGRSTNRIALLVGMHMRANQYEDSWTDGAVRRLIRDAGDELESLLSVSTADVTSYRPARVEAALDRVARLRQRCARVQAEEDANALRSPLDGDELMALFGRGPGPWIRDVKSNLLELVIEGKLNQEDKDQATLLAKEYIASQAHNAAPACEVDSR